MKKTIYLNKKTNSILEEISKEYNRPKGQVINLAIQYFLHEYEKDTGKGTGQHEN